MHTLLATLILIEERLAERGELLGEESEGLFVFLNEGFEERTSG